MAACGGGGACRSSCSRSEEDESDHSESQTRIQDHPSANLPVNGGGGDHKRTCSKCGEAEAAHNGMCAGCFRAFLLGKFKLAVTTNAMIAPTDNVLLAYSGGPASRVALQFIHEMQYKALKSWDASNSQALPVFGVNVAFIDESVLSSTPAHEVDEEIEDIRSIISDLCPPAKTFHVDPIESIYSLDRLEGRNRLKELLQTISDETGKEDFLRHLRMCALQKIAMDNNYTKLVLGSCSSAIARHIISSTVKGQGYSLPADLQYVDSRWDVPVVLPLRDCIYQELSVLCHMDSLKTQHLLNRSCSGINGLVSSFVTRLQEENPSRERTIVRTAEKLKPFHFNQLSDGGCHKFLPSRLRPRFKTVRNGGSSPSEDLCLICGSPLSETDVQCMKSGVKNSVTRTQLFAASCCQSCRFQIIPKDMDSCEHFYSLLPGSVTGRAKDEVLVDSNLLREQIKDCLLSEGEDDRT